MYTEKYLTQNPLILYSCVQMYKLTEFRKNTKEAFDKALDSPVYIVRGGVTFVLSASFDGIDVPIDTPSSRAAKAKGPGFYTPMDIRHTDFKLCGHGASPEFCKHASPGKPCKK